MAFDFKKVTRSEVGERARKTMSQMLGLPEHLNEDNFNFGEFVLSKYGSIKKLKDKAKGKDLEAQRLLSSVFKEGIPDLGIEKDLDMAMDLLESSLENGNDSVFDRFELASLHDLKGTVSHQVRAYELYLEAAQLDEIHAQLHLAEMYRCGVEGVVHKDLEEAFKWYRRAAGERESDAHRCLHPSHFVQGNLRKLAIDFKFVALKCLHKYYMCGDCPEGEPQPVKALYYLKKAAELGDPEAQKDLGLAYLTGESGHPKDLDKAKRWLGKAAKNGEQQAKQVLEAFGKENTANDFETEEEQLRHNLEAAPEAERQFGDLLRMKVDQNKHPFVIQNMIFDESMFTQFPNSPTAKRYLKAFQLVKNGLEIIQESNFKDIKGISLLAYGYLYENSILQSFPILRLPEFDFTILSWIDEILESNPSFFEGLIIMIARCPFHWYSNFESCKLDLRRTMALSNLIHLIKKAEPDKPPKEDPYNFEEDYSSWLHVLYYFLGSHFIITKCYKDGAEAFDMALKCCPNYYEAKLPLGHCLMHLKFTKHQREYVSNDTEKLLEMFAIPKNQRILKGDYLSWTDHQLRQKAKQLFMEFLQEAPECDKKYQDGYYHLAVLYMLEGNVEEAVKWKEKGEDSEEKRLPFVEPLDLATKAVLARLDMYSSPKNTKTCSNGKCRNKGSGKSVTMRLCPCRAVSYCGRACQEEDWKEHKKTCPAKKKRKERQ